jgi:hypothetical protein
MAIQIKSQSQVVTPKLIKPTNIDSFVKQKWDTVLSDHAAQLLPITDEIYLLTWNIMTRGRGLNNAYRKVEDPHSEYKPRLTRIAKELAKQIRLYPQLTVITLQEVPFLKEHKLYFYAELNTYLPSAWIIDNALFKKSEGSTFGVLTLYDESHVEIPPQVCDLPPLTYQQERVLAVKFNFLVEQKKSVLTIVNGHFRYEDKNKHRLTIEETRREINAIFNALRGQVIIAADLNQSTERIAPYYPKRCYHAPGITSLSYEPRQKKLIKKNIDCFIFKEAD